MVMGVKSVSGSNGKDGLTAAPLVKVPSQVVEATYLNYQPHIRRPFGVLDWPALLRKLDRIDPGYRD